LDDQSCAPVAGNLSFPFSQAPPWTAVYLYSVLQSPLPEGRTLVSRALQGNSLRPRRLLAGTGALPAPQSRAVTSAARSVSLSVEQSRSVSRAAYACEDRNRTDIGATPSPSGAGAESVSTISGGGSVARSSGEFLCRSRSAVSG